MWRVAAAVSALSRTIEESKALIEESRYLALSREYKRLERIRQTLERDARQLSERDSGTDYETLMQRIARYYQDVGTLERDVEVHIGR